MTVEDRLRDALRAEATGVAADERAWAAVQAEVARRRRARTARLAVLAAAAVVAAVVGVGLLVDRDDARQVDTVPAGHGTTTTAAPTTTVTTPPSVVPGSTAAFNGIWPFSSQREVDAYATSGGDTTFLDPDASALAFASRYLGMPDPVIARPFFVTEGRSGIAYVHPDPTSPQVTAVWMSRVGGPNGPFEVYDVRTDDIQVDRPSSMEVVGSTISLSGTSIAFEAVVNVEVRQDGQLSGDRLGSTTVMGGGTEMAPFSGSVSITTPTAPGGAVLFQILSAKDGSVASATVVDVVFDQT